MPRYQTTAWDAKHPSVHREDLLDDAGQRALALLRHPSYPFRAQIAADPQNLFKELCQVAEAYLERVAPIDAALDQAYRWAKVRSRDGFGWVPLGWDAPSGLIDPYGSFAVRRSDRDGTKVDCTLVLMAGNRRRLDQGSKTARVEAQGVGLRVVMHVDPGGAGTWRLRVSGLSASMLHRARGPENQPRALRSLLALVSGDPRPADEALPRRDLVDDVLTTELRLALQMRIAEAFGFSSARSVSFNGFELIADTLVRIGGVGARDDGCRSERGYLWLTEYDFARLSRDGDPRLVQIRPQLVEQFSAGAAATRPPQASVFLRDAASAGPAGSLTLRRVTRGTGLLDRWRKMVGMPELLRTERFEVLQSLVADPTNKPEEVQRIRPSDLPLRSDHLAAAHAFCRAAELFGLIERIGLRTEALFRFARLPLRLRHRAWFHRNPDGKSINAQVRVIGAPLASLPEPDLGARPRLQVDFGAAALRHREVQSTDHGRHTAQPMGLAADPRWAWHEFGHVLGYAATGALEFHFAHSVGDALAAVLNDPESKLGGADGKHATRGETFPWVSTGRRHDRQARLGWCWCGRRNGMRHAALQPLPLLYKGYIEEQMLSSSIFRLYRAIGGDTPGEAAADITVRKRAAESCAYLVMRALMLCGPSTVVSVRSADAFVSALVDADIGSRARRGTIDPVGGTLHKVVRWAFEQQGLFATDTPTEDVEGEGSPPPVDLWVEDRRQPADGGYSPVPLRWGADEAWHAVPGALRIDGDWLRVRVGNRGAVDAQSVQVRAWAADDLGPGLPLAWQMLGKARLTRVAGRGRGEARIRRPAHRPRGKPFYVLAEFSCPGDRSNLDPASALPCSGVAPPTQAQQIIDLVANDNNLALRRFG